MKVYVLERGCYDDSYIVGVYATPEAAMAAHQPKREASQYPNHGVEYRDGGEPWSYEWSKRTEEYGAGWGFGADWGDAASITEYEIEE